MLTLALTAKLGISHGEPVEFCGLETREPWVATRIDGSCLFRPVSLRVFFVYMIMIGNLKKNKTHEILLVDIL
jgi:hypothetical protein